jgi:hypothetical protein
MLAADGTQMVMNSMRQKHKTGKIVVCSNSVAKVKKVAKKLSCHVYRYKAIAKASISEEFVADNKRVRDGRRHTTVRHPVNHTHRLAVYVTMLD